MSPPSRPIGRRPPSTRAWSLGRAGAQIPGGRGDMHAATATGRAWQSEARPTPPPLPLTRQRRPLFSTLPSGGRPCLASLTAARHAAGGEVGVVAAAPLTGRRGRGDEHRGARVDDKRNKDDGVSPPHDDNTPGENHRRPGLGRACAAAAAAAADAAAADATAVADAHQTGEARGSLASAAAARRQPHTVHRVPAARPPTCTTQAPHAPAFPAQTPPSPSHISN